VPRAVNEQTRGLGERERDDEMGGGVGRFSSTSMLSQEQAQNGADRLDQDVRWETCGCVKNDATGQSRVHVGVPACAPAPRSLARLYPCDGFGEVQ
jgi:hypothetical protein